MKVETSITLSADIITAVDALSAPSGRSEFIEKALRSYLAQHERAASTARDFELINQHAERLNEEAADVLTFQGEPYSL